MNSLRSFYSNVLYTKASNYLTVPGSSDGSSPLGNQMGGVSKEKKRRKSSKSLSNISDNFIRAVENMESVVLIPTKLLDIPVAGDMTIPDLISSGHTNLYEIYRSIKGFKEKLTSLNVTDEDEEEGDSLGGGASISGPSSSSFDVDDIIANLTASLCEQGLIDSGNFNPTILDNNNQVAVKDDKSMVNHNNNLVSLNGGQMVTGQIVPPVMSNGQIVPPMMSNGPSSVPSVTILKSVPSSGAVSSMGSNPVDGAKNGDGQNDSLSMYCDSGVWSSEGSGGSSRDSIDDMTEEFPVDGATSPSGRLSVEPSDPRSRKTSATRAHYGLHSVQYHRQQIMSAASRYVVKKSLSSAKGFCSFLIELTQVTESVITKYMEEIEVTDDK